MTSIPVTVPSAAKEHRFTQCPVQAVASLRSVTQDRISVYGSGCEEKLIGRPSWILDLSPGIVSY